MGGNSVEYTVFIEPDQHMVFGAERIGKILKRGPKEIGGLVTGRGLKAWQEVEKGQWRALMSDLLEFNNQEKERYFTPVNR